MKRNGATHRNTKMCIVTFVRSANLMTGSLAFHNLYKGMPFRNTHTALLRSFTRHSPSYLSRVCVVDDVHTELLSFTDLLKQITLYTKFRRSWTSVIVMVRCYDGF